MPAQCRFPNSPRAEANVTQSRQTPGRSCPSRCGHSGMFPALAETPGRVRPQGPLEEWR